MPVSEFSTDSLWVSCLKNEKTKFKAALRKYLNTHSFYSVDELFMYKDSEVCNTFIVFKCKIL
jgi:hypothetical protein